MTEHSKIKIDSGIPLMDGVRPAKYPLRDLEVGQSFFAPVSVQTMSGSVTQSAKRTGFMFASRTVTEDGIRGTRVWRVA